MVAPILDDLAAEYAGKITIAKVNTDENSQWAVKYGVQGIPTMLFVKDGKEVDRMVGAGSAAMYSSKIEALLDDTN
jgi:thioredoxin 1